MRAWGEAPGAGREGCPGPSGHSNQGDGNLRLRIAVVPLVELVTTVVIVRTFRLRGALFPVDLLPRALVPREVGAAATAARLSALILPSFRWITVLARITGPHILS